MLSELETDVTKSTAEAVIVAEKLLAALEKPFVLKVRHSTEAETEVELLCTASIGVALFLDHESGADEIIKRGDMAMYQAKAAGGNLIRFFLDSAVHAAKH